MSERTLFGRDDLKGGAQGENSVATAGLDTQEAKATQGEGTAPSLDEALRNGLSFNQTVLDTAPVGILTYSSSGQCLSANPAAADIAGATVEQLLAQNFRQLASWKGSGLLDAAETALATGSTVNREAHHTNSFGKELWVRAQFAHFAQQNEDRLLVVLHDVLEVRRAEQQLRNLFTNMSEGFALHEILLDRTGKPIDYRFLAANPAFERLTGLRARDIVGRTALEVIPKLESEFVERYGRVALTGEPVTFESRAEALGRDFEITAYRAAPLHFACIFSDVSERKRAQEAICTSEARLRLAIEGTGAGTYHCNHETGKVDCSPEFLALYGLPPDATLAMGPDGVPLAVLDEDRAAFQAATAAADDSEGDGVMKVDFRIRRPDGSIHWHMVRGQTVFGGTPGNRRPIIAAGVVMDITERKQAEEARRQMEAQLQHSQKMESIGTLAGGIAHDFNNVLAAVQGGVELALLETDDLEGGAGQKIRNELEPVLTAAHRATALVKQILSFSRKSKPERHPLLLEPIVREVCKFIRATLPSTIEIRQALASQGPIVGNAAQIHQILMNLLTNAGLAMPSGGRIDIQLDEVDTIDNLSARLPTPAAPRLVRILVHDTGVGIDPETIDRIFEPFFTTRPEGQGSGLGLSVVRGIVTDHQGVVNVTSALGEGTTFEVLFPLGEAPSLTIETQVQALGGHERILFVDDEEVLANLASRGLVRLGYEVLAMSSSLEALRAFRKAPHTFDVVISDMTMPDLPGDVLASELRRIRPDIPLVLLTGTSDRMNSEKAVAMKIDAFLQKPLSIAELTVRLRRIFDAKKRP